MLYGGVTAHEKNYKNGGGNKRNSRATRAENFRKWTGEDGYDFGASRRPRKREDNFRPRIF
jgi:hypothetical protein